MSLTIKGATSGSVDVVAPASGSDVTLTLPTTTATVETTASSIASSRLTGALPAVSGALLTNLPAGGVDGITSASSSGTAINISSGNLVGIGTATPNSYYSGYDDLVIKTSGHTGMTIVAGTSSTSGIAFADGTSGSDAYEGELLYNHNSNELSLGNGGSRRLIIDSSGRVTMPSQPAFNVHAGSALGITANTWHQFVFSAERFDIGSNFSGNVFTAPITGKYQLSFHTRINNLRESADYYQIRVASSNKSYFVTVDPGCFDSDSNYWSFSLSALADMDSNDTAYVSVYQNGGASSSIEAHETVFSGYLVA
jgi:hypothetical protein